MQEFYRIKERKFGLLKIFLAAALIFLASIILLFLFNPDLSISDKLIIFTIYFSLFLIFLKNRNIGLYMLGVIIPFNLLIGMIFPIALKFNLFPVDLVVAMLLIAWMLELLSKNGANLRKTRLDTALIFIALISWVSILPYFPEMIGQISKSPLSLSLFLIFKSTYSTKILFSLNALFRVGLYVLLYFYIVNNAGAKEAKRFFFVLMASFLAVSLASIAMFIISSSRPTHIILDGGELHSRIDLDSQFYAKRSSFPLPHPNALAGFSLLVIPLSAVMFIFARKLTHSVLSGLLLIVNISGFLFTQSRGAFLAIDISLLIVFLALLIKPGQNKFLMKKALAVLILFAAFSVLALHLRGLTGQNLLEGNAAGNEYFKAFATDDEEDGRANRIWPTTLEMIKHNPIMGVGLGAYSRQYGQYISQKDTLKVNQMHAHNFYLHILAEIGIIGFILYILVFYAVLKSFFSYLAKNDEMPDETSGRYYIALSIGIGFTALLIHSFFDNLLFWREISALFWVQAGFLFVIAD